MDKLTRTDDCADGFQGDRRCVMLLQGKVGGSGKTSAVQYLLISLFPPEVRHLLVFRPSSDSFPFDGYNPDTCKIIFFNDFEPTSHLSPGLVKNVTERFPGFPLPQKNSAPVNFRSEKHLNPVSVFTANEIFSKISASGKNSGWCLNDFDVTFTQQEGRVYAHIQWEQPLPKSMRQQVECCSRCSGEVWVSLLDRAGCPRAGSPAAQFEPGEVAARPSPDELDSLRALDATRKSEEIALRAREMEMAEEDEIMRQMGLDGDAEY